MIGIELFGFILPLWAIFLIVIVVVILAWKVIKFAIKLLLIMIVIFLILMGLDFLNVFGWVQNLFSGII
jgi:hypothetical protein